MSITIDYLSKHIQDADYGELCKQIYYVTDHPKHKDWFFNKHLNDIGKDREVVFIKFHNNICGVAFLKKTINEKKICTFYVAEYSRKHGIGGQLLEECFNYLDTKTPLISMPKYKVQYFLYYVYKYGWKITQILPGYYNNENDEVVFNGELN